MLLAPLSMRSRGSGLPDAQVYDTATKIRILRDRGVLAPPQHHEARSDREVSAGEDGA